MILDWDIKFITDADDARKIKDTMRLTTHFEPSELTEPSLESFEPCFANLGLFAGITSELRWTPLVPCGLLPPRIQSKKMSSCCE